jgi:hypothetical protein
MPDSLFWVNKDTGSTVLSRSSKAETRQIRKHVQHERQLKAKAEAAAKSAAKSDKSPPRDKSRTKRSSTQHVVTLRTRKGTRSPRPDCRHILSLAASPIAVTQSPSSLGPLLRDVSAFPGLSSNEHRSLVFFCQRTAPEWSGWRDAAFWNKLILQACHLNQSIIHGVVALGALHESSEIDENLAEHFHLRELAMRQSSKASRMAYESTMPEITTLLSCVIFICLQNLQDSHAAYQLLKTGHGLITEIDLRLSNGELLLTGSEETVLNNFIRPIIERLRMRFCSIVDMPSALALSTAVRQASSQSATSQLKVPSSFVNLLEARNKLEDIISWAQDNIDPSVLFSVHREQVQLLLLDFNAALEDTIILKADIYEALKISKKLLRAASLVSSILFATLGTSEECAYDEHIDKFAEIIGLYQEAIGCAGKQCRISSFGIDAGVVDTLAFVAGRCRHPILRRAAIHMLSQTNRTEGDLQGCTGGTIMQTLMDQEEEGLVVTEAADIPETSRIRIWEDHQYWKTGEIRIFFVRWPYDPAFGAETIAASVFLPLKFSRAAKEKALPRSPKVMPNVKYGRGFGAFLDEGTDTYHNITLSSFFMPMPRL